MCITNLQADLLGDFREHCCARLAPWGPSALPKDLYGQCTRKLQPVVLFQRSRKHAHLSPQTAAANLPLHLDYAYLNQGWLAESPPRAVYKVCPLALPKSARPHPLEEWARCYRLRKARPAHLVGWNEPNCVACLSESGIKLVSILLLVLLERLPSVRWWNAGKSSSWYEYKLFCSAVPHNLTDWRKISSLIHGPCKPRKFINS